MEGEAEDEAVTDNETETHLIISTSARSALQPAVVVLKRLGKTESDQQSSCTQHSQEHCGKKEEEQKRKEHLDVSSSEADVQPSATVNVRDATSNTATTQDESTEATRDSTKPPRAPVDDPAHTGATTCGRDEAQLHTRDPQTARASDKEGGPSSRRSASINLDTLDLDQLKREKIKMQMKVLKLQEEYYTLKIQEFRK
ncbi:uncharacterized protein LOC111235499 isoform X3 [Seriola dumerili]|uniref:uncharacterized protein LOC111235499 isoform X3 n=1 Tax=Seriola dumerili TaxID=41447 RepID=UPI000BBF165F|nr:uncharacterized protein LOC111235499 isoform X3 [Seriola dumerili]